MSFHLRRIGVFLRPCSQIEKPRRRSSSRPCHRRLACEVLESRQLLTMTVGPASISVQGLGGASIANHDTPSLVVGTHFGVALPDSAPISRTFTVRATHGFARDGLIYFGTPTLPDGYTITEPLDATIPLGGSDTFTVQLDTATEGTFAGNISIPWDNSPMIWYDGPFSAPGDSHIDYSNTFSFGVAGTVTAHIGSTAGLFAPKTSIFYARDTNDSGCADATFAYGAASAGWKPIAGDWNVDGQGTIGLYDPAKSIFYLRNTNNSGYADMAFAYGPAAGGWLPIAGDWNGDGRSTIGLYNPKTSTFYLRNSNDAGYADLTFAYGPANAGWLPTAGDWNGDGCDTVGLYDPTKSVFYLRNTNDAGYASVTFAYGAAGSGWKPVAGDWNADGKDTIGLYDSTLSQFYLKNRNESGYADVAFVYGPAHGGSLPIVSNWNSHQSLMAAEGIRRLTTSTVQRYEMTFTQGTLDLTRLPWTVLSETVAGPQHISIDTPAAGLGWIADSTPSVDESFADSDDSQTLDSVDAQTVDQIDLLTIAEHESGYILGLDYLVGSEFDVMLAS